MREDERELYRLHARLPVFRRRVDRAMAVVRGAMESVPGDWAVSASGGKDSVALAALAVEAGWRGPIYHYWADETPIGNTLFVADLAQRFGLEMVTQQIRGDWALWHDLGRVLVEAQTAEDRRILSAHERAYKAQIEAMAARAGWQGVFLGLRAEESRARRITVATRGTLYRAASRTEWTALPLAAWTGRDVWAYLLTRGLPWLPVYDKTEDRERQRSETTYIFGAGGDGLWARGQGQRLRETDPALWARLCAKYPELRIYG